MEQFAQLGLSAPLLKAIEKMGYQDPTDIQAQAIPQLLEGDRDFIGLAQTGTGKTAAFGLPMLDQIDVNNRNVQALILAPTRELGQQIAQQIEQFSVHMKGLRCVAVYGGANISTQMRQLRDGAHVVIATPGRLIDLAKRKALYLDKIRYVVLDEADEMLNMGFRDELDTILSFTPEEKSTWLFSATMPKEIRRMVKDYMNSPAEVKIDPQTSVNANIEHLFTLVRHGDKSEALARFLDLDPNLYGVVFCRTKRDTQNLAEDLLKLGYRSDALHGDLSQMQRDRVMRRFKSRELQVLIATDVAARGIDVNELTHVFHYSLPDDQSYYTHRSGRTARAGKQGISLAFISKKEKSKINRFAQDLDISFGQVMVPSAEDIADTRMENWAMGILDGEGTARIPSEMLERVEGLFEGVSKEELIARLMAREMAQLNSGSGTDLNKRAEQEPDSRGGGGRGRHGGGGGGKWSKNRGGHGGGGGGGSRYGDRDRDRGRGGNDRDRGYGGGYGGGSRSGDGERSKSYGGGGGDRSKSYGGGGGGGSRSGGGYSGGSRNGGGGYSGGSKSGGGGYGKSTGGSSSTGKPRQW